MKRGGQRRVKRVGIERGIEKGDEVGGGGGGERG